MLANLDEYRLWRPGTRITVRNPGAGSSFRYARRTFWKKWLVVDATITDWDKGSAVGWRCGTDRLIGFTETYRIEDEGSGSRVRHSIEAIGFFGRLASRLVANDILTAIELEDAAFVNFVKRVMREPAAPNRHRRRAAKYQSTNDRETDRRN
ncbi:hypothetical protein A8V01_16570 [Novosphingobium guangzhouense]|uniref:Polyketide cyclase n=2 Tax=Novosphingobium guangzhouense TaxID=1850347 RepID=A0A2K2G2Z1_9SPHN|nr:hypothetical protein A8V01_16570 [Novosphingobium guangzhouense]